MDLVLILLMWFMNHTMFLVFLLLFIFCSLNSYSWLGLFLYLDSFMMVMMIIMSIFILSIIVMSEKNNMLIILSEMLVLVSILFFMSSNMMMLYMYFELSMFPILVMILGYGTQIEKINSSYYLLFYAALCSFPFLFVYFNSSFLMVFCYYDFLVSWEMLFILSLSFMMKFPIYFLHLWLPKAHVEAPTTASMLLAGLLLKLGTIGFLRILGGFNFMHSNIWMIISFLGMILSSFCCLFQSDSKSLAAYSSVTHMSFVLLSLVLVTMSSKMSSIMLMLAHGYTSTLMFYLIGEYYHTSGSRMIYFMNGFFGSSMLMGIIFSLVFLSNSGVPPSLSFLAEFIIITNSMNFSKYIFLVIFIYFVVSFYYSLFLMTNSLMGKQFLNLNTWNLGFSMPLSLMMYNMFWFSLLY
uniref:NADH-ubiquinone oxidoreductase chain 4 n=1 Tax=Allodiplogaster sudhausi TaxID=2761625 RepID=A0A0U3BG58_9BILA|nr:NADH dehydrogenase subunit 4 [Allodiplogaster sudhausi]ALT06540.1 NADH dehydrogenase subunit 4 [Allodiplogaster sudhausi]